MLKLARWLNILLIFLTLLAYTSPFVSPEAFWPIAILGLVLPWLLLLNVLFILIWTFVKKWYFILSLGVLVMGFSHIQNLIGFYPPTASISTEDELNIVSFNTHRLYSYEKNGKLISDEVWRGVLNDLQPDILCIQEFQVEKRQLKFIEIAHEKGLTYSCHDPKFSLAIFSKFPINNQTYQRFGNVTNGFQRVEIDYNGKTCLTVYNVHLNSNRISGLTNHLADEGDFREKDTWLSVRKILGRYKRGAVERVNQAKIIAADMKANLNCPVLLCGDLNDPPQSFVSGILSENLEDTFKKRGQGIGVTYAGKIPGLRIDYILTDPGFETLSCKRGNKYFSDHRPVIARLKLSD